MSILRELAAFVVGGSATNLPPAERAAQRRHVADTLVATVAGSRTSEGRALRGLLPHGTAADAAGLLTAVTRHTEIDDIHLPSCTTPSAVTVPTAFALAHEAADFTPDHVASAVFVATELMTRLGTAIDGPRVLYRGLWPTYFAAPLAGAAVAARLWRLSEDATAHALSLALMLTAGRAGRFQGKIPGRAVILGLAVSAGVRAAEAARDGFGGDPDLLDGPWLREAQGLETRLDVLTSALSDGAGCVYTQMSLKPFCCAKQAIAAVEAFTTLIDGGIAPDGITHIRVRVPPLYARMIDTKPEAGSRSSTIVSAALQMGLAAFDRARLYDVERAHAMQDPRVLALAQKVEIVADDALLESFPLCFPAEVEVTAAGNVARKRVTAALGDPPRPLDEEQLTDKAQRVLEQLGDPRPAAAVVELGLRALQEKSACKAAADMMWDACTK